MTGISDIPVTNPDDEDEEWGKKRAIRKDWVPIVKDHIQSILRELKTKNIRANLRKMFYILVSKEIIGNTKSDYNTLSDQTVNARMNGILPIDCFVDEGHKGGRRQASTE